MSTAVQMPSIEANLKINRLFRDLGSRQAARAILSGQVKIATGFAISLSDLPETAALVGSWDEIEEMLKMSVETYGTITPQIQFDSREIAREAVSELLGEEGFPVD